MFSRFVSTTLPSHTTKLAPQVCRDHIDKCVNKQKCYADQHTKPLAPLSPGQHVELSITEPQFGFLLGLCLQMTNHTLSRQIGGES